MTTHTSHIECFDFEKDFIEDNLRCIPMIVRMKLDIVGIKLPLKAWSRFSEDERTQLALDPCKTEVNVFEYKNLVLELAKKHSIESLGILSTAEKPDWDNPDIVPELLLEKSGQYRQQISISQWRSLSNLKRFALIKLSRPGHENKNFGKALVEFGLFNQES